MKRAAQPAEIAPSYVFLASEMDSSYMTGQVLHLNAGMLTCSQCPQDEEPRHRQAGKTVACPPCRQA